MKQIIKLIFTLSLLVFLNCKSAETKLCDKEYKTYKENQLKINQEFGKVYSSFLKDNSKMITECSLGNQSKECTEFNKTIPKRTISQEEMSLCVKTRMREDLDKRTFGHGYP